MDSDSDVSSRLLPPLVLLTDFENNWNSYLEAIYEIFRRDFVLSKPYFEGKRFALKRYPLIRDKEATSGI